MNKPISKDDMSVRCRTAYEWCETTTQVFQDQYAWDYKCRGIIRERIQRKAIKWFIAEVQSLYLRESDVFAYELKTVMRMLKEIKLENIVQTNNYWVYYVGDLIFINKPLEFHIDHLHDGYFNDKLNNSDQDAVDSDVADAR